MAESRLKVLWLSHLIPYPPKGGALIRSYHLIREVARYHEIDLLAFDQKAILSGYFSSHSEGRQQAERALGSFLQSYQFFGIPSEAGKYAKHWTAIASLFSMSSYTMRWLKSDTFGEAVKRRLEEKKYDVVHFDTISLADYLVKDWDWPLVTVLNHHNIESEMMLRRAKKEVNPLKKVFFYQEGRKINISEKDLANRFSLNIVCSEADGKALHSGSNVSLEKIEVIPNGVEPPIEVFRKPSRDTPNLLFIGGLSWYPNRDAVHYFLDYIWPIVRNAVPNLTLDIVGKNPTQKLLAYALKDPAVRVHGFVNDIRTFYETASIYICPIRDGGGTKLKILDALAHGVPLVANPIACEGINVDDGKHVLMGSSEQEFAIAIINILDDQGLSERLSESGRKLIEEHYSVRQIGARYAGLIHSLVAQSLNVKSPA